MQSRPSRFTIWTDWLLDRSALGCTFCISIAWLSVALGFDDSRILLVLFACLFLIAQLFVLRWMMGPGMKSVGDMGFESNRQALLYFSLYRGFSPSLIAVGLFGFLSVVVMYFLHFAQIRAIGSGAILVAMIASAIAAQAGKVRRRVPADAIDPDVA